LQQGLLWIKLGIKVDNHGYQNNQLPGYYIELCGSQMFFEKNPNIRPKLSETRRFFEAFQSPKTGGSL
jgi:hypothetical protein